MSYDDDLLNEKFEVKLNEGKNKFKVSFIENNSLEDFNIREEKWIKNNLAFIYAKTPDNVFFKINPYQQIVKCSVENDDSVIDREYILLPKYLVLKELHIHAGLLEKADLLIKVFINYANSFTLCEITEQILKNSNQNRKDELNARLQLMIRKFLSYQYLVID